MSSVDVLLFWSASPERARSLLTVRAAISSAVSSSRPRSSSPSLMCSYWRSRLALQAFGMPVLYPLTGGIVGDPHQHLAEVAAGQHAAERLGCRLQPLGDV